MQFFYDTDTNKQYAFEDDVIVTGSSGSFVFTAPYGTVLGPYPTTLIAGMAPTPTVAPPTLAQQAESLLASGLTVTSASASGLNSTYPVNSSVITEIEGIQQYIATNGTFPNGASTLDWNDINGVPKAISSTAIFTALATAIANFVTPCEEIMSSNSGVLPSATVTII